MLVGGGCRLCRGGGGGDGSGVKVVQVVVVLSSSSGDGSGVDHPTNEYIFNFASIFYSSLYRHVPLLPQHQSLILYTTQLHLSFPYFTHLFFFMASTSYIFSTPFPYDSSLRFLSIRLSILRFLPIYVSLHSPFSFYISSPHCFHISFLSS